MEVRPAAALKNTVLRHLTTHDQWFSLCKSKFHIQDAGLVYPIQEEEIA